MKRAAPPAGFTLVELLVVTGLMAAFLGLVVAGLRPSPSSHVRQYSQMLFSSILSTQTQAFTSPSGAALMIAPGEGTLPTVAGNQLWRGDLPPSIVGTVTGIPPATLSVTSTTAMLVPSNADAGDLARGFAIRFSGSSPYVPATRWLGYTFLNVVTASSANARVFYRTNASQWPANMIWPIVTGSSLQFEVALYPTASTQVSEIPQLAAIDLRYSGVGETLLTPFGSLDNKGTISIAFDRDGRFQSVMQSGTANNPAWIEPTTPLYLLIASVPDILANTSLTTTEARWAVLVPGTSRITFSQNVAVASASLDVTTARANARLAVNGGAR